MASCGSRKTHEKVAAIKDTVATGYAVSGGPVASPGILRFHTDYIERMAIDSLCRYDIFVGKENSITISGTVTLGGDLLSRTTIDTNYSVDSHSLITWNPPNRILNIPQYQHHCSTWWGSCELCIKTLINNKKQTK